MEKAIVVDIDGTVALNDHREYHNYSDAVLLDKPIKPVINADDFIFEPDSLVVASLISMLESADTVIVPPIPVVD